MKEKPRIIVIVGPTSSGKTALSIALAKAVGGEIISADSRQVYKGLNLGTGKVTKREMEKIPHHLLDVASPKTTYTVSNYVKSGRRAIADILSRGKVPIICGGTGLYVDALLGTISIPEVPPDLELRKKLEKKSVDALYAMLQKLDPERAAVIDRKNPVRLIRAIEIAKAIGKTPPSAQEELYDVQKIGLTLPKEALEKRIHARLMARMRSGMLREAKRLHATGLSWKRMEALGLEYRYMARHLQNKLTKQEMLGELEKEIRAYAKRQMLWFKRDKAIVWLKPTEHRRAIALARKHTAS